MLHFNERDEMDKIYGLVLCGGYSSRMGKFKPLLQLRGSTIVEQTVSSLKKAGIEKVLCVTGHNAEELSKVLDTAGICHVHNANYDQGMFTSVQAGISNLPDDCEGTFILPVDCPLCSPAGISKTLSLAKTGQYDVIYPAHAGRRGHPPFVHKSLFPSILAHNGEGGLRTILNASKRQIEVDTGDENTLFDLDTMEDYQKALLKTVLDSATRRADVAIAVVNQTETAKIPEYLRDAKYLFLMDWKQQRIVHILDDCTTQQPDIFFAQTAKEWGCQAFVSGEMSRAAYSILKEAKISCYNGYCLDASQIPKQLYTYSLTTMSEGRY